MSALSSAPIDSVTMSEIVENHYIDTLILQQELIRNQKNRIYAIALAPAIGKSDFEIKHNDSIYNVAFTPQLKTFHISTNKDDLMLKKVVGWLSNKLSSTDLGYKSDSFDELALSYKFLKRTDFSGMRSHDFNRYINNPNFNSILKTYTINTK